MYTYLLIGNRKRNSFLVKTREKNAYGCMGNMFWVDNIRNELVPYCKPLSLITIVYYLVTFESIFIISNML